MGLDELAKLASFQCCVSGRVPSLHGRLGLQPEAGLKSATERDYWATIKTEQTKKTKNNDTTTDHLWRKPVANHSAADTTFLE